MLPAGVGVSPTTAGFGLELGLATEAVGRCVTMLTAGRLSVVSKFERRVLTTINLQLVKSFPQTAPVVFPRIGVGLTPSGWAYLFNVGRNSVGGGQTR